MAVCGLNLGRWLTQVKAVERNVGRNSTDPRLLVALWIYATLQGVGSVREIARLCEKHVAYRWLCGGVTVNHHLLSDFRSGEGGWSELLTEIIAPLLAKVLVTMDRVAQDGCGSEPMPASRRSAAAQPWSVLGRGAAASRTTSTTGRRIARRIDEATTCSPRASGQRTSGTYRGGPAQLRGTATATRRDSRKSGRKATEARPSTTDPEARVMQFSDGGFRRIYTCSFRRRRHGDYRGSGRHRCWNRPDQLPPMLEQLKERYGRVPEESLVDGGLASLGTIDAASEMGNTVYAPLKEERKQLAAGKTRTRRRPAIAPRSRVGGSDGTAWPSKSVAPMPTAEWVTSGHVTGACIRCPCVARSKVARGIVVCDQP